MRTPPIRGASQKHTKRIKKGASSPYTAWRLAKFMKPIEKGSGSNGAIAYSFSIVRIWRMVSLGLICPYITELKKFS